jgi:hypothetical protein|tara:strand:+ start:182 stop:400 length:219 start_codon:yes stop_codon:yes gene_type:complete
MTKCSNKVIQVVEKGYDVKEVQVPCGSTSIYGDRLLCDKCLNDKKLQKQLQQQDRNQKADDDWLHSSGWGES